MPVWDAELTVDEGLARRLLEEQFPDLASLPIVPLGAGWDNTVYTVGQDWVFRFPRREVVLPGFRLEIDFLPKLAPLLPFAIPVPEHIGEPSDAFPWPFFGALKLPHLALKFPLLTRHVPHFLADREFLAELVPPQPVQFVLVIHVAHFA